MGYVDLRTRRREDARRRQDHGSLWQDFKTNPYSSIALGMALVIPAMWISAIDYRDFVRLFPAYDLYDYLRSMPTNAEVIASWIPAVALICRGFWQLRRRRSGSAGPKFGGEKQLLMAILDSGGSITPVEAALKTSLTVDEAEEILSRLANRGHLLIESGDGVLSYALPGKASSREVR